MNEQTPTPPPTPKKSKKQKMPRAPRVVDPAVLAIRQEAAAKVKELHRSRASGGVLNTIVTKLIPKLTLEDRDKLSDALIAMNAPKPGLPA